MNLRLEEISMIPNIPTGMDVLLQRAQNHVKSHKKSTKKANEQLFYALTEIFELGQTLLSAGTLQNFIEQYDTKLWSKTAEKNPFNPLIKLAFGDTNRKSQSQYSTVLSFLKDEDCTKEEAREKFIENTLSDLLEKASNAKKDARFQKFQASDNDHRLWAEQTIESRSPLYVAKLTKKQQTELPLHDGYQQAYIEIVDGELRIISSNPITKEQQSDTVLKIAGPPPIHVHQTLQRKSLYSFFVACDWLMRFPTKQPKSEDLEKHFIGFRLSKSKNGWVVEKLSTEQCFQSVLVELGDELDGLDPKTEYFFTVYQAQSFVSGFLSDGDWEFQAKANSTLLICTSKGCKLPVQTAADVTKLTLRSVSPDRTIEGEVILTKAKLLELKNWKNQHKAGENNAKFVSLLQLFLQNKILQLKLPNSPSTFKEVAQIDTPKSSSLDLEDRYIQQDTIDALAKAAVDYDVDFEASIFSVYEEASGLLCKTQINELPVSVFIPLMVSKHANPAQICSIVLE